MAMTADAASRRSGCAESDGAGARACENERLRQIIRELQRHRFGRRAETLPEDQMLLGLEEVEQIEAAGEEAAEQARPPRDRHARCEAPGEPWRAAGASAAHRDDRRHRRPRPAPAAAMALHRIGEDVSERLDIVPAQFRVLVVRRPKYACRACEDVRRPGPGAGAADRGRPADRGDRRPGAGLQICRSPAALSAGADLRPAGHQSRPLDARRLGRPRRLAPASGARAAAGEARRLRQNCSPTRRRRRCSIRAAARPRPASSGPMPATTGHGRDPTRRASPMSMRRTERPSVRSPISTGFTGILQVDGYGGYRVLADKSGVALAFCWAHVRRRFYELAAAGPAPIASEALRRIAELYRIEDDIRGRSAEQRLAVRQEKSRPIVADLEPWLRPRNSPAADIV